MFLITRAATALLTAAALASSPLSAASAAAAPAGARPAAGNEQASGRQSHGDRAEQRRLCRVAERGRGFGRGQRSFAEPVVIGHRGASGYRPEHTLASYRLAAEQGADFIEPDLVPTKDGVLVARHENEISGTTDVAEHPEFASRRATKVIDGQSLTGWFTEDFTLAELRTLRAKERLPQLRPDNTRYDGQYQVPTFEEILRLRAQLSCDLGREIGVYPEIKHPTYFDGLGLSMEEKVAATLRRFGLDHRNAPVYIQSFELQNLQDLNRALGVKVPLVFLATAGGAPYDLVSRGSTVTYADLLRPESLRRLARDIDGVGPDWSLVVPRSDEGLGQPTSLVRDAHRAGLAVHPWTVRAENAFLPAALRSSTDPAEWGDVDAVFDALIDAGVDGYFTDMPDLGVEARARCLGD